MPSWRVPEGSPVKSELSASRRRMQARRRGIDGIMRSARTLAPARRGIPSGDGQDPERHVRHRHLVLHDPRAARPTSPITPDDAAASLESTTRRCRSSPRSLRNGLLGRGERGIVLGGPFGDLSRGPGIVDQSSSRAVDAAASRCAELLRTDEGNGPGTRARGSSASCTRAQESVASSTTTAAHSFISCAARRSIRARDR